MTRERRDALRIPIPSDEADTLMRAGVRQFKVHLLDMSRQGFAVTCPESLRVEKGEILRLRTTEGWYDVRVVRIEPIEEGRFPFEYDCFLGLERLEYLGYGPDHNWLASVGIGRASLLIGAAVLMGIVIGWACLAA
jgi:hypothetical protein